MNNETKQVTITVQFDIEVLSADMPTGDEWIVVEIPDLAPTFYMTDADKDILPINISYATTDYRVWD